jgi:hypothetical protein
MAFLIWPRVVSCRVVLSCLEIVIVLSLSRLVAKTLEARTNTAVKCETRWMCAEFGELLSDDQYRTYQEVAFVSLHVWLCLVSKELVGFVLSLSLPS